MDKTSVEKPWKSSFEIPFPTERLSKIVYNTLSVDPEPRPQQVTRNFAVRGNTVVCEFATSTPQLLRVSLTAFFENITLIVSTIENFDIQT